MKSFENISDADAHETIQHLRELSFVLFENFQQHQDRTNRLDNLKKTEAIL